MPRSQLNEVLRIQLSVNSKQLLQRLKDFGAIGRDEHSVLSRLPGSAEDKAARGRSVSWIEEAGLRLVVDEVGNIFGIWDTSGRRDGLILLGSHIDTVVDAGTLDGSYGVIAGLEVIQVLRRRGFYRSTRSGSSPLRT